MEKLLATDHLYIRLFQRIVLALVVFPHGVQKLLFHAPNGFFMNWSGAQAGEGFEFHLLALALSMPLMFQGGGAYALDHWLVRRLRGQSASRVQAPLAA